MHIRLDVAHGSQLRVSRAERDGRKERLHHSVGSECESVPAIPIVLDSSDRGKIQKRFLK